MKPFYFTLLLLIGISLPAQNKIWGTVTDTKGIGLGGVNIFIEGSYIGTTSNSDGSFELKNTPQKGWLVFSMMGFETLKLDLSTTNFSEAQKLILKEAFNKLKAVTVTAGSIEVSDSKNSVVLKPLDIVTTSGALGDVMGALNTLPGTASNANDGRLFVRGGSADETAIFIDGLRLGNAYGSNLSGIPTRGRFSAQLFKGSFFSTGAYSAEYGQALSSVLSLNSLDFPLRDQTDFSLMTVGGSLSNTKVWEKQSLTTNLSYTNLQPYMALVPQNVQFKKAPNGISGETLFRQKFGKKGLLKAFYAYQWSDLEIQRVEPDFPNGRTSALENNFHHLNLNYRQAFGKKHLLDGGISYSFNKDNIQQDSNKLALKSELFHAKFRHQYFSNAKLSFKSGAEYFNRSYQQIAHGLDRANNDYLAAIFSEANYYFNSDLVAKLGLRYTQNALSDYLSPRLSLAYRIRQHSQISAAYGQYIQSANPAQTIGSADLRASKAQHWVVNYQYVKEDRTLRFELYQKSYQELMRQNPNLNTGGEGYARGFDLFYRSRTGIKNLDYWISYSFIDSKRHWRGFQNQVQPSFAPKHNASIVGKYWINALNSQIGMTYSINDGYTYHNPNLPGEMQSKTRFFNTLNLSWSYLPKPNLILHLEITNVLGSENIFGYQYSSAPNENGRYTEMAIPQSAPRFIFFGLFYTLSADKKANQLNNL